ncbi:hypothetical protein Tco_1191719 [Tanacetum coccineum]
MLQSEIKALEIQIGQMSKVLQERGSGSLPSLTETNPRDHVKSISTFREADTSSIRRIGPNRYAVSSPQKNDTMPLIEHNRATIPFPGRLMEYGYDNMEVMKELEKLQIDLTKSTTSLRRLMKEKSRIEEEIKATMNAHCSPVLEDALPPKEKDPMSFTLTFNINNIHFEKALADLGASVSCNTPKNGSQRNMFPGALLHNTIAQVMRERPLTVSFEKKS